MWEEGELEREEPHARSFSSRRQSQERSWAATGGRASGPSRLGTTHGRATSAFYDSQNPRRQVRASGLCSALGLEWLWRGMRGKGLAWALRWEPACSQKLCPGLAAERTSSGTMSLAMGKALGSLHACVGLNQLWPLCESSLQRFIY